MSKDIKLLAKYTARLSVSVLNVFNHFNPLDVHANTADLCWEFSSAISNGATARISKNPVLGSSAISSTLSDFAYFVGNGVAINTNWVSWVRRAKPASRVRSHPGGHPTFGNSARP